MFAESEYNIVNSASSTRAELLFNGESYSVSGLFFDYYQRSKVDGRYTTDLPGNTKIFRTVVSQIPQTISSLEYNYILFKILDKLYKVRFVTTTSIGVVNFDLIPTNKELEGEEE